MGREGTVGLAAGHGAAEHDVVATPGVIGADVGVGVAGAVEFAFGEHRHALHDAARFQRRGERVDGGVNSGHQLGVVAEQVLVVVEAAHAGEEDLPVHAERVAHGDDLGHLGKLLAEAGVRERHRQRRRAAECALDLLRRLDRLAEHAVGGAHQLQAAVEGQQLLQRPQPSRHRRAVTKAVEAEGIGVREVQALGEAAGQEQRVAPVHRDAGREHAGVVLHGMVVEAAAPPGAAAVWVRGLPLLDLVGVRIQVFRQQAAVQRIPGGGPDQRADIEDQRGAVVVEEPLDGGHRRVQTEAAAARGQQRFAGQSDSAAHGPVGGVARIDRHNHVVRVVAPEQEDAHEGLVVGGRLGEGRDHAEAAELRCHAGSTQ